MMGVTIGDTCQRTHERSLLSFLALYNTPGSQEQSFFPCFVQYTTRFSGTIKNISLQTTAWRCESDAMYEGHGDLQKSMLFSLAPEIIMASSVSTGIRCSIPKAIQRHLE
jgi:hypothetical protein